MTVLEVTAVPFSYNHSGGGERYPTILMKELSKIENVVGCYSTDENIRVMDGDFIVPSRFVSMPPFIGRSNPVPTFRTVSAISGFLKEHRNEIDIIHIHNLRTAMSTAWLTTLKMLKNDNFTVVLTDHNSHFFPFPSLTAGVVDYYAPVSGFSDSLLQKLAKRPSRIIPVSVSEDLLNKTEVRNFEDRTIDLLFIGRIVPWKAPDMIIEIANYLRSGGMDHIKCIIAGRKIDESYFRYLVGKIEEYGLENNVQIIESPSDSAVIDLYANSRIHVLMSCTVDSFGKRHGQPELAPATLAEAGVFGTPSLISDSPGIRDEIEDGITGFTVKQNDFRNAGEILKRVLQDQNMWKSVSTNARKHFMETRSPDRVAVEFKHYLDDIRAGNV